jgi:methylated-DNA-[protein]-cysteine S-methyltransferase
MNYVYKTVQSPVGELKLITNERGLSGILWEDDKIWRIPHLKCAAEDNQNSILLDTQRQLSEYFARSRRKFDLTLDFEGTDFEKKVWDALLTIPFGETRTYGEIADQIGHPGAARAVGVANSRNPIAIVAPCHRVIGANGKLTGFAGGLKAKDYLLNLESDGLFR